MFAIFAVLFIVTLILFVIYTINVFAKKTLLAKRLINKLLIIFASFSFVAILGVLFYSTLLRPEFDVTTTVLNFLKAFTKEKIFGVPLLYSVIGVIILFASNCILSSKSERKKLHRFLQCGSYLFRTLCGRRAIRVSFIFCFKRSGHHSVI